MKKVYLVFALSSVILLTGFSQIRSGDWILEQVDKNIGSDNKIVLSSMIIHGRRGDRTIKAKSWLLGREKSFSEYLSPPREKGMKMLKLEDQLWTYSPTTDRIIKISGHMLRQSVMGSDMSYEDMMEDPRLHLLYTASVIEEETFLERECWVLELVSKDEEIAYHTRKIWVDKERFVALKENRYARSGKLLKTTEIRDVKLIDGRWIPSHVVFKDELRSSQGTEFIIETIEFDADVPEYVFTKASLRR
jgi:outer membrane lipoprotein-sorting protein